MCFIISIAQNEIPRIAHNFFRLLACFRFAPLAPADSTILLSPIQLDGIIEATASVPSGPAPGIYHFSAYQASAYPQKSHLP